MAAAVRLLGGLLLVLAVVAVWRGSDWLMSPRTLPLRHVEVVGKLKHAPVEELRATLQQFQDRNFIALRVDQVRRRVEANPWVARAQVSKRWPDTLRVQVEERRAVARWGGEALLDSRAEVFAAVFPGGYELPRLDGPGGSEAALLQALDIAQRRLSRLGLTVEALSEDARGSRGLSLRNGLRLELGREEFEARLTRFATAYAAVLDARIEAIATVDLRYANGFTVRWRAPEAGQG